MALLQVRESTSGMKDPLTEEACWALLNRVVASPRLQRAARLRDFLLYVGRRSLQEGSEQIHEQEIGSEVFGRQASYDTSVDNIVRVNATELRKRIEAYFEGEGLDEPILMEIPRGSYRPVFRHRFVEPQTGAAVPVMPAEIVAVSPVPDLETASVDGAASVPARRWVHWIGPCLAAVLMVGCVGLWLQNVALTRSAQPWRASPALSSFWSEVFETNPSTDVIVGDTSLALIEDITKKPISLSDYLNRRYVSQIKSEGMSQDRRDDLSLVASRDLGSPGDFRVAQRITSLDPLGHNIRVHYALEYMPALLKRNNVVLIGSRKSNPWVDLFSNSLNFSVEYDSERGVSYVKNRQPAAGEQATYISPPAPASSGYSVIAYLPGSGPNGKVIILAGTDGEATEGAGEFLTSEEQMDRFRKLLNVSKLP
ncbi:hypothetical protein [Granulicella tundricola]|uniref:Uncharacterized protein n=1 Tax=Granulicella tundricola (strain ATCC BAA-1859 / DSM 23138 / MP5ACTX9) TaxID=1198114 RepID=E8WYV6_GRATM|nr:hypothetical protein [Granulicella tundricola]ADW68792.1 hypothetical protein AciX9_1744 [Granulicella tundricola MP5ACTX9]